jgi:hypothetical protein
MWSCKISTEIYFFYCFFEFKGPFLVLINLTVSIELACVVNYKILFLLLLDKVDFLTVKSYIGICVLTGN